MTDPKTSRTGISPLWVISLFLSFTEVVLGVAVTKTAGAVQVALTTFVVAFPLLICGLFFFLLWHRNYVFYPPREFGENVDVAAYVNAMRQHPRQLTAETVSEHVTEILGSPEFVQKLEQVIVSAGNRRKDLIEYIRSTTQESIRRSFVRIDSRPLLGSEGRVWDVPYDPKMTVKSFLDGVWAAMHPHLPAFSYRVRWLLRDASTQVTFRDIGTFWARSKGDVGDFRPIEEVGIRAGSELEVVEVESALLKLYQHQLSKEKGA